jgi:hypothetical protein
MRKSDLEVREVVCSETGKPMPKIPLWMADVNVKFVSDEARQKHSTSHGIMDVDSARRGYGTPELDEIKDIEVASEVIEDADAEFADDMDAEEIEEEEADDMA